MVQYSCLHMVHPEGEIKKKRKGRGRVKKNPEARAVDELYTRRRNQLPVEGINLNPPALAVYERVKGSGDVEDCGLALIMTPSDQAENQWVSEAYPGNPGSIEAYMPYADPKKQDVIERSKEYLSEGAIGRLLAGPHTWWEPTGQSLPIYNWKSGECLTFKSPGNDVRVGLQGLIDAYRTFKGE